MINPPRCENAPDRRLWAHQVMEPNGFRLAVPREIRPSGSLPKCFLGVLAVDAVCPLESGQNGDRREQGVRANTKVSRCVADAVTFGLCGTTPATESAAKWHHFRHHSGEKGKGR